MIKLSARNFVQLFEKKWCFKIIQLEPERLGFFYPGMVSKFFVIKINFKLFQTKIIFQLFIAMVINFLDFCNRKENK